MVVNWTGGYPERDGYWMALIMGQIIKGDIYDCEPTPIIIRVFKQSDGTLGSIPVGSAICLPAPSVQERYSDLYENGLIRFSTTPLQIHNIDWDYKYEEGE